MTVFRDAAQAAVLIGLTVTALFVLSKLAHSQEVRFCFNDWPPYTSLDGDEPVGITVDIIREASRRANMVATFHERPWARCLKSVRSGQMDGVLGAMERPEFAQGPASFSVYTNTFWVRQDAGIQRFDAASVLGCTIGLVHAYKYPPSLERILDKGDVVKEFSAADAMNIRKLAFERVDVIVADYASTLVFARKNQLAIRPLSPTHSLDRLYPSFNKGREALQRRIDQHLADMLKDGFIDAVYVEHLGIQFNELVRGPAAKNEGRTGSSSPATVCGLR